MLKLLRTISANKKQTNKKADPVEDLVPCQTQSEGFTYKQYTCAMTVQ